MGQRASRISSRGRFDSFAAAGPPAQAVRTLARIGCQVYQPLYGMDLAALCVRKAARQ